MTISWMVTTLCNYACDFCIQGDKEKHIKNAKGESRELRDKITAKICRLIEEEYDGKYDHLKIFLIGGEVTILPDCIEIVERLVNTKFRGKLMIHITSNMSADLAWFRDLAKVFEDHPVKDGERHLFLGCSYYKEYVTEEEFISKLHAIQKMGISKNSFFQKICKKILNRPLLNITYRDIGLISNLIGLQQHSLCHTRMLIFSYNLIMGQP